MVTRLLLLLVVILTGTARAEADSYWDHNGSFIRLTADGNRRTLTYEEPRATLRDAGVRSGMVLFEGFRNGNRYSGKARRFSRHCSEPLLYDVQGVVTSETRIVLKGSREVFDSSCRPTGRRVSDTLVFNYFRTDRTDVQKGSILADAARGSGC